VDKEAEADGRIDNLDWWICPDVAVKYIPSVAVQVQLVATWHRCCSEIHTKCCSAGTAGGYL